MTSPLLDGFCWRESPHQPDRFNINPHRKVHTLYFEACAIARIEPVGRGLVAQFLLSTIDTPGRSVVVPNVARGKTFVQNWLRPRQAAVMAACHYDHVPSSSAAGATPVFPSAAT